MSYLSHRGREMCCHDCITLVFFFSPSSCGAALCTLSRSLHEAWSSWLGREGWLGRWCLTAATAAAVFRSISSFPHELKKPSSLVFFSGRRLLPCSHQLLSLRCTCERPTSPCPPVPDTTPVTHHPCSFPSPSPASFDLTFTRHPLSLW